MINGEVYKQNEASNSKKEAKEAVSRYAYKELMRKAGLPVPDDRDPITKLSEYCQGKDAPIKWSDIGFKFDINNDGTFNCKISLSRGTGKKPRIFDQDLHCKYKEWAKNAIAEYVYNKLMENKNSTTGNEDALNQASSSGANQPE